MKAFLPGYKSLLTAFIPSPIPGTKMPPSRARRRKRDLLLLLTVIVVEIMRVAEAKPAQPDTRRLTDLMHTIKGEEVFIALSILLQRRHLQFSLQDKVVFITFNLFRGPVQYKINEQSI